MNKTAQYVVVFVLVFLAGAVTGWKMTTYMNKLEWSLRDLADSKAQTKALEKNQAITAGASAALEKNDDDTKKQLQTAQDNAAAASAAADSLRETIDELQRKLRDGEAATGAAVAGQRKADAAKYAGMLAVVLRSADDRAGELAKTADDARIRGLACEKAYSNIRELFNGKADN